MSEEQKNEQAQESTTKKANGESSPLVVKLRKAVIANGDEVMELSFREPTAGDIERVGNPVNIDFLSSEHPKATFDSKMMTQMMATLAGVPPSTIRQMNTRDWNTAAYSLASFFMPEM